MVYQRIAIKFGTSTLTAGTPFLALPHILDLVRQITRLHADGSEVILISSGTVATGREALKFPELPKFIPSKQMLSAVGQPRLMGHLRPVFSDLRRDRGAGAADPLGSNRPAPIFECSQYPGSLAVLEGYSNH
jgi:glutamate 5-kinase